MDFQAFMTAISTVGFPIAACCVMFWYMNKQRESHQQETKELTKAIADLNVTIQQNSALVQVALEKLVNKNE